MYNLQTILTFTSILWPKKCENINFFCFRLAALHIIHYYIYSLMIGFCRFVKAAVKNTISSQCLTRVRGTFEVIILNFLKHAMTRSTWIRRLDISLDLATSSPLKCFFPRVKVGISNVAPWAAHSSVTVKPLSARTWCPLCNLFKYSGIRIKSTPRDRKKLLTLSKVDFIQFQWRKTKYY